MMAAKQMVKLQESGYEFQVDLDELAQHGDDVRGYTDNIDDVVFFSKDYAIASGDHTAEELAAWPDNIPVWAYRPA